jgi:hypothetical protein
VYRTSTGLVLAVMLFSIVNFVFNDHFPFPNGYVTRSNTVLEFFDAQVIDVVVHPDVGF